MTTRGRVLVVALFLLAAALCATAAIALVMANDDDPLRVRTIPSVHPTVVFPTPEPTGAPSASATASSSPSARAASPTPSATRAASPSASPQPHVTTSPKPSPTKTTQADGLRTSGTVDEATGATPDDFVHVRAHATDGDGSISLLSLDWGDGVKQGSGDRGKACSPPAVAPKDCRDFAWTHKYAAAGSYTITIWIQSGLEKARLQFHVTISPSPS